jgi:DNA-binding response OmpR family regulator
MADVGSGRTLMKRSDELDSGRRDGAPPRLYLVDSFADEAEMYAEFLGLSGLHVRAFADSGAGLAAALADPPDIVVCRIRQRPGQMTGIEMTARLREAAATRHVPVLVITTSTASDDHAAAREAGGRDVVLLPVTPDVLLARVRALLGSAGTVPPPADVPTASPSARPHRHDP